MTPSLVASADVVLRVAAEHLWQSTVILGAAAMLCLMARRYAARLRYAIYLLATTKFLVPFAALMALGSIAPWPTAVMADPPVVVTTVFTLGPPLAASLDDAASEPAAPAVSRSTALFPEVLLFIWAAGSLIVATRRLAAAARVHSVRRRARPVASGREHDSFVRAGGWAAGPQVTLCTVPEGGSPCVAGIVRPALLWPEGLSGALSDAELDAVMTHELAHVRRRHNLGSTLHAAIEIVFWFHPGVWWLGARLVAERERACDEDVLRAGTAPSDYAGAILKVCECSIGTPVLGAAGITSSTLTRRMEAIMSARAPQSPGWFTKAAPVLLALGMFIGPMAAGSMSAQVGTTGRIAGVVTDERGGVLPDVSVTARAATSGVTRSAVTDQSGRYSLGDLMPGEHELRFTRDAFRPHVVRIDLSAGAAATADARLRVGSVTESITLKLAPSESQPRPADSEATLLQRIADRPEESASHLALAELYYREERFAESASVMARAAALFAAERAVRTSTIATAASGDIKPPRKLRDVTPIYPADARAAGVTGMVLLEATIGEDGTVQDAVVRRSVPMLDEAALGAVRQWLFTPTLLNGVPVAVTMSANIFFTQD